MKFYEGYWLARVVPTQGGSHLRYEDKVQANPLIKDRYCFRAGDWYRAACLLSFLRLFLTEVNFPTDPKPTGAGPDDCNRHGVGLNILAQRLGVDLNPGPVLLPVAKKN